MGATAPPPRPGSPRAGGRGVSGAHRAQLGPSGAAWSTDPAGQSPEPRGGGGGDVGQRRILSCPQHGQRQVAALRAFPGRCLREEGRAAAAGARAVPERSETPAGAACCVRACGCPGAPSPGRCAALRCPGACRPLPAARRLQGPAVTGPRRERGHRGVAW